MLSVDWSADATLDSVAMASCAERWGHELREAADDIDVPLVIVDLHAGHEHADVAAEVVGTARSTIDEATGDGVPIELVFIEPGITGPDRLPGLLDADRTPTPLLAAFLDT